MALKKNLLINTSSSGGCSRTDHLEVESICDLLILFCLHLHPRAARINKIPTTKLMMVEVDDLELEQELDRPAEKSPEMIKHRAEMYLNRYSHSCLKSIKRLYDQCNSTSTWNMDVCLALVDVLLVDSTGWLLHSHSPQDCLCRSSREEASLRVQSEHLRLWKPAVILKLWNHLMIGEEELWVFNQNTLLAQSEPDLPKQMKKL